MTRSFLSYGSIHLSLLTSAGGDGAEVIYALRNEATLANSILSELAKVGQNIRGAYQRRSMVNPNNDYYFMQRNTAPLESITIEYGFLDSTKDDVNQLKNNWKKYTEAAVQGILNYINYNNDNLDNSVYIVKAGDTLYSISQKYNTTVSELKRINNITNDDLYIGQRIKVPISNNSNYYIVRPGDTLYSISRKYNIPVQELMSINNLINNNLYVGQKIYLVSTNTSNQDNIYIVKLGDTLYSIAKRYNVTVDDIKNINGLNSNLLTIGQELIIPN